MYSHDRERKISQGQAPEPAPAPAPSRLLEDAYPAAATAAVALAQLHNHRPDSDWESDAVCIAQPAKLVTKLTDNRSGRIPCPKVKLSVDHECTPPLSFRQSITTLTKSQSHSFTPLDQGSSFLPLCRALRPEDHPRYLQYKSETSRQDPGNPP